MTETAPVRREIEIVNRLGLHARAAAKLVSVAERFKAEIEVSRDGQSVSALSIMGLMMLGAGRGEKIQLEAMGEDATAAMDAVSELVMDGFGERD